MRVLDNSDADQELGTKKLSYNITKFYQKVQPRNILVI